jgi:hypothetical protein
MKILAQGLELDQKNWNHQLTGFWDGFRDRLTFIDELVKVGILERRRRDWIIAWTGVRRPPGDRRTEAQVWAKDGSRF